MCDCYCFRGRALIAATALVCTASAELAGARGAEPRREIVVRDFRICQPQSALAATRRAGKWQVIPYSSGAIHGQMLAATSLVDPPTVTLPLRQQGWYRITVGIWNPIWGYDGRESVLKLKMSNEPCFRVVKSTGPTGYKGTILQEYEFGARDVTGQDLRIAKRSGQKGYLAYVRLTPLAEDQVTALLARRATSQSRVLVASHDGGGYLNRGGAIAITSREDIWAEIEPYRYSDVKRVSWAVNYSHTTNWPSRVGTLFSREFIPGRRDEASLFGALNGLIDQGINPLHEACQHAHRIGIEFDAQFRMAMLGRTPPDPQLGFVAEHPSLRMVARDGTAIEKASYAFAEARAFLVSMVRDTVSQVAVDGVTLNFIRGGDYFAFESPVREAFAKQYHGDARQTEPNDERLLRVRAAFMTQLVREVRAELERSSQQQDRQFKLHALVYPTRENNLRHGLDITTWIEQGLIDSILGASEPEVGTLAHAHRVEWFPGVGGRSIAGYLRAWTRWHDSADGYFVWDMDNEVEKSADWQVLGQMGHDEAMRGFAKRQPGEHLSTTRLTTVGGVEVIKIANEEAGYPQKFLFLFSGG
ncbi:MAG: hypothetical protein CMJ59_20680 [Planctomycetaceae bacterium]|nr:hypothetical protein [Planctomycetaceae bacterium]